METKYLRINPADNVAVAIVNLPEMCIRDRLYGIGDTEQGPHCQREIVNDTRTPFC